MHHELNRQSIDTLVRDFYADVRRDGVLQPVFDGAIGADWEVHLERMVDFWSSVMLSSGEFKGNVYGKHMQLRGIQAEHFRRWLGLFEAHARRMFAPDLAEAFLAAARRIAASLQYGYFGRVEVA
ncbi:group III truncated hemoglobin [Massilia sp.]|uniref:group III truncated hemoglobin n=1 Tax=Massilia sp. TaxID=1882437 RepID=UPI003919C30C